MLTLLRKIGKGLKRLLGLVLPMFAKARGAGGPSPAARRVLHVVMLLVVLVVLAVINRMLGLDRMLAAGAPRFLKQFWLPLLFLLVYALIWLVWWFWKLLHAAPEVSPFPDIDRAWEEARAALQEKNLDLTDAPLFLLLGRPDEGEEALFDPPTLTVQQAPARDAPLHVYANQHAIYVTCVGTSLLGQQARILAGEVSLGGATSDAPGDPDPARTRRLDEQDQEITDVLSMTKELRALENAGRARSLTKAERLRMKSLKRSLAKIDKPKGLHEYSEEVERLSARLRHLCGLIARDRRPFCGVNGIMALIPMAATDDERDANETGTCLQEDLAIAREALQVQCPVFALVCGLEQVPGFDGFIANFNDPQRGRIGQRFPLVPDIPPDQVPEMLKGGVKWLGLKMFPGLALPHWKVEVPGVSDLEEATRTNGEIFRFLSEVRERQAQISSILERGVVHEMFGGCYIAGTGRGSDREKAFLRAVFARLTNEQDYVSWTPEALAEEEAYHRMVWYGYRLLGVLVVAAIVILAYLIFLSG